jgi:hypothetical protein
MGIFVRFSEGSASLPIYNRQGGGVNNSEGLGLQVISNSEGLRLHVIVNSVRLHVISNSD